MGIHERPILQHWNYFLALDDDIERMSRYIEPAHANFNSYSLELARIIFAAASEVDVVSKMLCKKINPNSNADSIKKYKEEILPCIPAIPGAIVSVPRFGLTLNPWEQWAEGKTPLWWSAYNNVKHHRHTHFADANLKHTLNAVAGLFVLLLFYYRDEGENARLNPAPRFFRAGHPFQVGTNVYEASETIYTFVDNEPV